MNIGKTHRHCRLLIWLTFCLFGVSSLPAAINPEAFKSIAEESLHLKEIFFFNFKSERSHWFRTHSWTQIYIVAEVVEVNRSASGLVPGDLMTIFYRLDHEQIQSKARAHQREMRGMPGAQFLYLPNPPHIDEEGKFWAHLRKLGNAGIQRLSGLEVDWQVELRGNIYVPAAHQYSFEEPYD
jgi:hypothetical protein